MQRKTRAETEAGEAIRSYLDEQGLPAHVSGLDVLLPFCNQFYFSVPHLVVCEPGLGGVIAFDLVNRLEPALPLAIVRDQADVTVAYDHLVVLIEAAGEQERLEALATPVEAWLETYRALRAGVYPLAANELGQMVRLDRDKLDWGVTAVDLLAAAGELEDELARAFRGDVDDARSTAGGVWGGLSDPY